MAGANRHNYFDKLLEKAVARDIIPEGRKEELATLWHRKEKNESVRELYLLLIALSAIGMGLGVLKAVPETLDSEAIRWLGASLASAFRFFLHDFRSIFSQPPAKAAILFLAGLLVGVAGSRFEGNGRAGLRVLAWPLFVAGAVLHAMAAGYLLMHGIVEYRWEELEVTGAGLWSVAPLLMVLLGGGRPLFYQLLTAAVFLLHVAAYLSGVSGNIMVAFDIGIAVILISAARLAPAAYAETARRVRYMAMAIVCFVLYCTGFVWDLPAILEFRGYIKPGAHQPTLYFLAGLIALSCLAVVVAYFRAPTGRTVNDRRFMLLLLLTLFFACFATNLLMGYMSVGHIFDLFHGRFKQTIFTANGTIALVMSWTIWFLWCLWILVESRETGKIILAQIGVTAMLGSIEIRYVEICRNFSFGVGLIMLPIALVLAAVSARFLGKWLNELLLNEGERAPPVADSAEGGRP